MNTNRKIHRILIIDDEKAVGEFICEAVASLATSCIITTDRATFFAELTPDTSLILLDLMMPETDGIELLRILANQQCKVPIVLMSGIGKRIIESAEKLAVSLGLTIGGNLQKPFRLTELEDLLKHQIATSAIPALKPRAKVEIPDEELVQAIEQNQFVLHYQPQLNITTSEVVGIEALVRWKHPLHGLIFPDEFIARLEHMGLIDALGWIVADLGLAEMKRLNADNGCSPVLSLNVSAFSLYDLNFTDNMIARLKHHDVAPQNVILEITESGLIKDLSSTLDVLTRLRMKQVKLSIDDFGTGYAMMQQLRLVPATELKIDKSFVQNMHTNDSDRVMVKKTIEIGHELGMMVVAEGVETAEQLAFLRDNGCDVAQGYLFSRPIPMPQLVEWIAHHDLVRKSR
jgi:EAL domain-containing protein (putative c-di-GMP-specific phosphodiesterase class I)/FixJ family two-component response regulator